KLGDANVVADAIPDLKRYGDNLQVWSELALAGPIDVVDAPGKSPQLEARKGKLLISIKTDSSAETFKPCAEFDLALKQPFTPKLVKPTSITRALAFEPDAPAEIEVQGHFASGYEPRDMQIDNDRLRELFSAGWDEFIKADGPPEAEVPDIDLGYDKLR